MSEKERLSTQLKAGVQSMNTFGGRLPFIQNLGKNYAKLKELMQLRSYDIPEPGSAKGPVIVLGSGPSLDEAIPFLKETDIPLWVTPSQLWTMLHHKIQPDCMMVHDPWPATAKEYLPRNGDWNTATKKALGAIRVATHPGVHPDVFKWRWITSAWMYLLQTDPFNPNSQSAIDNICLALYTGNNPEIKHPLNHVIMMSPSTSLQAAILASYLGYSPIYMIGYDLCQWRNRTRAQTWGADLKERKMADWDKQYDPDLMQKGDNGYMITASMLYEKIVALSYFHGMEGFDFVEVVADGEAGNMAKLPRIELDAFAGGLRTTPGEIEAARELIPAYMKEIGVKMGPPEAENVPDKNTENVS